MKSKLILPAPPVEKSETFPLLRKSKISGCVVLFSALRSGTVVVTGNVSNSNQLSYFSRDWSPFNDGSNWEKLPEGTKIEITV